MSSDYFTSSYAELTTTLSKYYTSPSNTQSVVTMVQVANKTTSDKSVWVAVSSSGNALYYLANSLVVPTAASVGVLSGKLVLNSGDHLYACGSAASSVDLIISTIQHA